ncbi:MAG: alpha/beta hydrolase [Proteobacteria bacterium]|nr:alpha/beta hydrolase [Pseudomonadota bacterium]
MAIKFVDANGLRFGYLERGTGPLVVLLHGFPDTAYTWDATMDALAGAGYRAVAPFTRGYHPTAIPRDGKYDTDTLATDVLALIDALRGDERDVILVGHDWGASAAYGAAALGADRIRLLVTLAIPHPRSIRPSPRLAWTMRHFVTLRGKGAAARVARDDLAMVDTLVKRWSPSWTVPVGETDRVKVAFRQPGCLDAALGYYRAVSVRLPHAHQQMIAVPTIAFAGEHDLIAPRSYEKARIYFTGSYEVLQVPGGHFMHREHPAIFTNELVRALRDHDNAKVSA